MTSLTGDLPGPGLWWLVAASGLLIALACGVILLSLVVFLRRRHDFDANARQTAALIAAFMLLLALYQMSNVVGLWHPSAALQGALKGATALAALGTALAVWRQIPNLLALPSPQDMTHANLKLTQANASLESAIAWRTHELEQANQRFEQALSRSNITVYTQDTNLRFTWIHNPRLGLRATEVLGRRTEDFLRPGAEDESLPLKRRALDSGLTSTGTVAVATPRDGTLYLDMTVSPTVGRGGEIDGVLCAAVDVTEKRLFEVRLASMAGQLGAASHRFELALENSGIVVFEQDADLRYTYVYNPPEGTGPDDYIGRTDADIFAEHEQRRLLPAKQRVMETGEREVLDIELAFGGIQRFFVLTLEPVTSGDGSVVGVLGTGVDLTERRQDEKRMRLMMRELTHRSKNLLAVIQAMARKTASLSGDIDSFIADFSSRLRAMAAAHDLLVSHAWQGADLGDLLRASVSQTIAPDAGQIRIEGPTIMLAPDAAQNLALAFHELTTNASKYGALSVDAGMISIAWRREAGRIRILWQESGGPTVTAPERRGFGRVLLERLVGATLNGTVTLDFRPEGLVCEIDFPEEVAPGG